MTTNHTVTSRIKLATGVDVDLCYQCGKCTAGCVLADDMDYPSSYVMRLLQTNKEENYTKVLKSNAIWLCVNCENCIGRCPKEVDIPVVMDYLRAESLKKGLVSPKAKPVLAFHKSFLDSVRTTGKLNEIGLIAEFKLRTMRLWQDVKLVPSMLAKGKLKFLPETVKGKKDLTRIFKKTIKNTK
jgi:heterodisulfide reductase subunit C